MKAYVNCLTGLFLLTFFVVQVMAQQSDVEGSRDHSLLSRMDNYYISNYNESDYDSHQFYDEADNEYMIEGRKWVIDYTLQEGSNPPGQLKVFRNHINAIKSIGGEILFDQGLYMKVKGEEKETWIEVWASDDGSDYSLTIVERTTMKQEVVADPEAMAQDISKTGHVAVYGVFFDFDSSTIKPESEPTLKAIAEMLMTNPKLEVYIVGHTDMEGRLDYNMTLSRKRAEAVVQALVQKYSVASSRLQGQAAGPLCPVSTNRTEEGRKLNRRVEIVERI